ncbi:MAG TPA: hypothetical protein PLZ98_09920, partial [Chitinophagaceae bacterium]|nr:hypothetical protein [Chitinophagaceae bacterium]
MEDKNSNTNGNQQPNTPQKKGPKFNIWWVYGLFAIALIVLNFWGKDFTHNTKEETFQNINSKFISKNLVDSMVVYPKSVDVYLKKYSVKNGNHDDLLKLFKDNEKGPHYTFTIGNVEQFSNDMKEVQKDVALDDKIQVTYAEDSKSGIISFLIQFI